MTIHCLFSCLACGLKDAICDVPARGDEDLLDWMEVTLRHIWAEHRRRSPLCAVRELSELKIPMTGADRIGGPTVQ